MTPKKKVVKAPTKKKVTSAKDEQVKGKAAPKKKVVAKTVESNLSKTPKPKKETKQSSALHQEQESFIYEDADLQKPITHPKRDLIKILIRNPHEAFIFWNILPSTYSKAVQHFNTSESRIGLQIDIEYLSSQGKKQNQSIQVHPLSQSYLFRFDKPVTNLGAVLSATCDGMNFHLFESAPVSLPRNESSDIWDEDWVNPEWVRTGILVKGKDGKYRFAMADEQSEIDPVIREKLRLALERKLGGSSPFGSSFGSSSSQGFSK